MAAIAWSLRRLLAIRAGPWPVKLKRQVVLWLLPHEIALVTMLLPVMEVDLIRLQLEGRAVRLMLTHYR